MKLPLPASIHVAASLFLTCVFAAQLSACSKQQDETVEDGDLTDLSSDSDTPVPSRDEPQTIDDALPSEEAPGETAVTQPEQTSPAPTLPIDGVFEEEAFLALLGLAPVPPFYMGGLITPDDIAKTLGLAGEITVHEVPGLNPTPFHNGVRLTRSEDKAGIIFEVRYTPNLTEQVHTFEYLKRTNQHEPKRLEIGSEGFWSTDGTFTRVVSRDEVTRTIISVTCDEVSCHVPALLTFVRNAQNRLNG